MNCQERRGVQEKAILEVEFKSQYTRAEFAERYVNELESSINALLEDLAQDLDSATDPSMRSSTSPLSDMLSMKFIFLTY
jgi:hypothetical protein